MTDFHKILSSFLDKALLGVIGMAFGLYPSRLLKDYRSQTMRNYESFLS